MTPAEIDALATDFFAAITRGDLEAVASLYAPDVAVWHNVTAKIQTQDENLALLGSLVPKVSEWRYEEVRRRCFDGGFVQQHVLRGRNAKGESVAVPVCLVAEVRDGKVARIDEYLDSRAAGPLFAG